MSCHPINLLKFFTQFCLVPLVTVQTMNTTLLGAVGATLKSVGEKVGEASILSDIRSNFEETFEIK